MRLHMARTCAITGKTSQVGGGYSNRTRATKFNPTGTRRRQVNFQKKTLFIPELGKKITINVSAKGLKTMKKRGAYQTMKAAGLCVSNINYFILLFCIILFFSLC